MVSSWKFSWIPFPTLDWDFPQRKLFAFCPIKVRDGAWIHCWNTPNFWPFFWNSIQITSGSKTPTLIPFWFPYISGLYRSLTVRKVKIFFFLKISVGRHSPCGYLKNIYQNCIKIQDPCFTSKLLGLDFKLTPTRLRPSRWWRSFRFYCIFSYFWKLRNRGWIFDFSVIVLKFKKI